MFVSDQFGWLRGGGGREFVSGSLTLLKSQLADVRTSALLYLVMEWLGKRRTGTGAGEWVSFYTVGRRESEVRDRLLCLLIHQTPASTSRLRRARSLMARTELSMSPGDPTGRLKALADDVRALAGLWNITEVKEYRRAPASRPAWPDRTRFEIAREAMEGWRDRLRIVEATGWNHEAVEVHAGGSREIARGGLVVIDADWDSGTEDLVPGLVALATRISSPVVVGVGTGSAVPPSPFPPPPPLVIEVAEGKSTDRRIALLVSRHGLPAAILAFDPESGVMGQPLPGEFD